MWTQLPLPQPLVVLPQSGHHRQSIIALHGRGSNGERFGQELLATHISGQGLLRDVYPDAQFIFPTAAKRRAKIYKRRIINQWFDNWSLEMPTEQEELQFDGLRESTQVVHDLLRAEIGLVGATNVILWGLSQGCAASLVATILSQEVPFVAVVDTCGWLPLRGRMDAMLNDEPQADEDNPFASSPDDRDSKSSIEKVVAYLQGELDLSPHPPAASLSSLPVFLGHGKEDDRVPLALSQEADDLLGNIGFEVEHHEYPGLGHWYSGEMLRDIVEFIHEKAGWSLGPQNHSGCLADDACAKDDVPLPQLKASHLDDRAEGIDQHSNARCLFS